MKKKIFDEKTFRVHIGIVVFILFCFLIFGLAIYCYWKGKVDDVNGYNSIDSSIAFIALGINILTVIFVYATYQTQKDIIKMQRKQIEDDKKDGDFNRVMDIIFRQLEHTSVRYSSIPDVKLTSKYGVTSIKVMYDNYFKTINFKNINELAELNDFGRFVSYLDVLRFLTEEFKVYYNVINSNNNLFDTDKQFFTTLFANNIEPTLIKKIDMFQQLYFVIKKSDSYKELILDSQNKMMF